MRARTEARMKSRQDAQVTVIECVWFPPCVEVTLTVPLAFSAVKSAAVTVIECMCCEFPVMSYVFSAPSATSAAGTSSVCSIPEGWLVPMLASGEAQANMPPVALLLLPEAVAVVDAPLPELPLAALVDPLPVAEAEALVDAPVVDDVAPPAPPAPSSPQAATPATPKVPRRKFLREIMLASDSKGTMRGRLGNNTRRPHAVVPARSYQGSRAR
jgi:hypothetical protein